jgi:hypothetical protein
MQWMAGVGGIFVYTPIMSSQGGMI